MRRSEHCTSVSIHSDGTSDNARVLTLPLVLIQPAHKVCAFAQRAARVVRLVCDYSGARLVRLSLSAFPSLPTNTPCEAGTPESYIGKHLDHLVLIEQLQYPRAEVVKMRR